MVRSASRTVRASCLLRPRRRGGGPAGLRRPGVGRLAVSGVFDTKVLRVVERMRRTGDKLEYRATSYDPAVLADPWEGRVRNMQLTDQELDEPVRCEDRDLSHMVDNSHHGNAR